MVLDDLNLLLKQIVLQLVQSGFKLTAIGKVLLGSNSYTPILKLTSEDENTSFGYRPLARIGKLLHKELYLVYLDEDDELKRVIEQKNSETLSSLKDKIANYLNNKEGIPNPENIHLNTAKLDEILMNILGEDN